MSKKQGLEQLIQLQTFQLNEKKRKLKSLQLFSQDISTTLTQLEEELEREQTLANENNQSPEFFKNYMRATMERRANLLDTLEKVADEITALTETIAEQFQEIKRYEITLERRLEQQNRTKTKREQAILDEQGIIRYRKSF